MKAVKILWQFSRPHTIIGSLCSITALYIIACEGKNLSEHLGLYFLTLFAALACNVFIVGINQIADVEMDKINKPYLPLAAGTLSRKNALNIVYAALVICLILSFFASLFYLGVHRPSGIPVSATQIQDRHHGVAQRPRRDQGA